VRFEADLTISGDALVKGSLTYAGDKLLMESNGISTLEQFKNQVTEPAVLEFCRTSSFSENSSEFIFSCSLDKSMLTDKDLSVSNVDGNIKFIFNQNTDDVNASIIELGTVKFSIVFPGDIISIKENRVGAVIKTGNASVQIKAPATSKLVVEILAKTTPSQPNPVDAANAATDAANKATTAMAKEIAAAKAFADAVAAANAAAEAANKATDAANKATDAANKATDAAFARGTVTVPNWVVDYPDFSQALLDKKWNFILKAINGNTIGSSDSANFILKDANGKELLSDSEYSTGANGTIEFYDYIRGSDFAGVDLTRSLTGTIKVSRGYGSVLKDAVITVTIPVTTFPKRPSTSRDYVSMVTSFTSIPFPQDCTTTEFQFTVNDPYSEVSRVKFAVVDSSGKEIATATSYMMESGLQKEDVRLCSYALTGTSAPYSFTTNISFESATGKLALNDKLDFPLASKIDEAAAMAKSLGDYCAKGSATKIVSAGAVCPTGYKKVTFAVPSEVSWNSLTRMPNSQKGKNYTVYACVTQFDANTGGSKFRGYASPVQVQYYFSGGINAIFTGSAKQLLKLGKNSAFIAKVTVTGGVSYNTIGGKTSVPSFAIKQFQKIGSC
jgi:hypothetical protein